MPPENQTSSKSKLWALMFVVDVAPRKGPCFSLASVARPLPNEEKSSRALPDKSGSVDRYVTYQDAYITYATCWRAMRKYRSWAHMHSHSSARRRAAGSRCVSEVG